MRALVIHTLRQLQRETSRIPTAKAGDGQTGSSIEVNTAFSGQCVVFKLWTRSIAYTTTSQLLATFLDNTLISILVPHFPKSLPLGPAFNQVNYPPRRGFWKQALYAVPRTFSGIQVTVIVNDLQPERV